MEEDQAVDEFLEVSEKGAKERIEELCLERCDSMTCGNYEFPNTATKFDWTILVVITIVMLVLTWIGYLL